MHLNFSSCKLLVIYDNIHTSIVGVMSVDYSANVESAHWRKQ